jgi:PAS domain S-box-containing protein
MSSNNEHENWDSADDLGVTAGAQADSGAGRTRELLDDAEVVARWGDLNETLSALTRLLCRATPHTRAIIYLWDEDAREFYVATVAGCTGGLENGSTRRIPYEAFSPLTQAVIDRGTSGVVDFDALPEESRGGSKALNSHLAYLAALTHEGQFLGVIGIDDPGERREFTQDEYLLVEAIANLASVAIANARILHRAVAVRDIEAKHVAELALRQAVAEIAASSLDAVEISQGFTDMMVERLPADRAVVLLADEPGGRLLPVAASGYPDGFWDEFRTEFTIDGDSYSSQVYRDGQTRVLENLARATDVPETPRKILRDSGTLSGVWVPVQVLGRRLGVAAFHWYEPLTLDPEKLAFLEAVSNQIASAIENARLYTAEKTAAWELKRASDRVSAMHAVTEAMLGRVDPVAVAEAFVERASDFLGVAFAQVCIMDWGSGVLQCIASKGLEGTPVEIPIRPTEEHETARVVNRGERLIVREVSPQTMSESAIDAMASRGGVGSFVYLPLEREKRVIGVMGLGWHEPNAFSDDDVAFCESVAVELAVALEGARRAADAAEAARFAESLNRIDTSIHSTLHLDEIMRRVIAETSEAIGAESALVAMRDGDGWVVDWTYRLPGESVIGEHMTDEQLPHAALARERKEPVATEATDLDEVGRSAVLESHGVRSALVVPLIVQDEVVGILGLNNHAEAGSFSTAQVQFAVNVAADVSLAIDNAQLYEAGQEAEKRVRAELVTKTLLLEAAVALAESSGLDGVTQTLAQLVARSSSRSRVLVFVSDERTSMLWLAAEVQSHDATTQPAVDLETVAPAFSEALLAGRHYVIDYDALPPDRRLNADHTQAFMTLVCPIVRSGRLLGLVTVDEPGDQTPFDEGEIEVIEALSAQSAAAIENARFAEAEKEQFARSEATREMTELVVSSLDVHEVSQRAFSYLHERLGVDRVHAYTVDESGSRLLLLAGAGAPASFYAEAGRGIDVDGPLDASVVFRTGRARVVEDVPSSDTVPSAVIDLHRRHGMRLGAYAVLPLRSHGSVLGTLVLSWEEPRRIDEEDLEYYMSLSREIATALDNARLYEQVRRTSDRLTDILETMTDGFVAVDMDWRYTVVNPAAEKMLHRSAEYLLGKRLPDEFPDIHGMPMYRKVMQERVPVTFETYSKPTDAWVEVHAYPTEAGMAIFVSDISERKHAQEALAAVREQNDLLAALVQSASQPFGVGTPSGELVMCNKAFADLTGYTFEELREIDWVNQLTPPEYRDIEADVLARLESSDESVRYEKEYIRKDGSRVPIELLVSAVRDENGEIVQYYSFLTDISERRERSRLMRTLSAISMAVGATFDVDEILTRLHELATEALQPAASAIALLDGDGWRLHSVKGVEWTVASALIDPIQALPRDSSRFAPILIDDVTANPRMAGIATIGIRSLLAMPLLTRGTATGVLVFGRGENEEEFTEAKVDFCERLMPVVTAALENARAYKRERDIADALQEGALSLPDELPGLEVASLYRAASDVAKVGGDFYDVFEIGDGRVGILIGDVSGKGLEAARLTSLVRDGVRAYAFERPEAGWVLTRLNMLAYRSTTISAYATVFFAVLDPRSGVLEYARAGHPPAIAVGARGTLCLEGSPGCILGVFPEVEFESAEAGLELDEVLVLYTDGLTEARAGTELFGESRVIETLNALRGLALEFVPVSLVQAALDFGDGKLRDDVAILAVRRTPSAEQD